MMAGLMFTMSVTPLGKVFGWLINQPSAMKHTSIDKIEFRIRDCALTSEKYKTRSDLESVFHNRCWVDSPISKRGQLILTVTLSYITPITCRVLPFLLLAPLWFLSINPHKQWYIILKCVLNHYWGPSQSIPDLLLEPPGTLNDCRECVLLVFAHRQKNSWEQKKNIFFVPVGLFPACSINSGTPLA